jgi:ATP-dependent DNA helicase RecG
MNLEAIIRSGESETVEFKESFNDAVIETLTAFANASGGTVFVGIADDGTVKGTSVSQKTIPKWLNEIKTKTDSAIVPTVEIENAGGKSVAWLKVPEYPVKPVAFRGRYYIRRKNTNHLMTTDEVANQHLQTLNTSWDYYIDREHTLDHISLEKVGQFIDRANTHRKNPIKDDPVTVLKKHNLLRDGSITFGCYLLFNKEEYLFTDINAGLFQSETIIKDGVVISGDLFQEIDDVLTFITKHINKEFIITGKPEREDRWDYPLDALREIAINMIVHRDYRSPSNSIIKIFPNRIEFYNPGKLMPGVTVERLLQGDYLSVMRNKQIARIFKEANEIEQYGSGIKRIINSCLAYNLPNPKIEEIAEGVRVTVFKATRKTRVKTRMETRVKTRMETKVETSEAILNLIRGNPSITRKELATHLHLTMKGIDWNLNKLKKEGRLKRIGPDRGGYWEIM